MFFKNFANRVHSFEAGRAGRRHEHDAYMEKLQGLGPGNPGYYEQLVIHFLNDRNVDPRQLPSPLRNGPRPNGYPAFRERWEEEMANDPEVQEFIKHYKAGNPPAQFQGRPRRRSLGTAPAASHGGPRRGRGGGRGGGYGGGYPGGHGGGYGSHGGGGGGQTPAAGNAFGGHPGGGGAGPANMPVPGAGPLGSQMVGGGAFGGPGGGGGGRSRGSGSHSSRGGGSSRSSGSHTSRGNRGNTNQGTGYSAISSV